MSFVLIRPGDRSDTVPLLAALEQRHAMIRKRLQDELAEREKHRAGRNSDTPWPAVGAALASALEASKGESAEGVRAGCAAALGALQADMADPGEWVPPMEGLEGVRVSFAMVSAEQADRHAGEMRRGWAAFEAARKADDLDGLAAATEALARARHDLLCRVQIEVEGVEGLGPIADELDALRLSRLLLPLYEAADWFLGLPPGKALRCGLLF